MTIDYQKIPKTSNNWTLSTEKPLEVSFGWEVQLVAHKVDSILGIFWVKRIKWRSHCDNPKPMSLWFRAERQTFGQEKTQQKSDKNKSFRIPWIESEAFSEPKRKDLLLTVITKIASLLLPRYVTHLILTKSELILKSQGNWALLKM